MAKQPKKAMGAEAKKKLVEEKVQRYIDLANQARGESPNNMISDPQEKKIEVLGVPRMIHNGRPQQQKLQAASIASVQGAIDAAEESLVGDLSKLADAGISEEAQLEFALAASLQDQKAAAVADRASEVTDAGISEEDGATLEADRRERFKNILPDFSKEGPRRAIRWKKEAVLVLQRSVDCHGIPEEWGATLKHTEQCSDNLNFLLQTPNGKLYEEVLQIQASILPLRLAADRVPVRLGDKIAGLFVSDLTSDGPAKKCGLELGDLIFEVKAIKYVDPSSQHENPLGVPIDLKEMAQERLYSLLWESAEVLEVKFWRSNNNWRPKNGKDLVEFCNDFRLEVLQNAVDEHFENSEGPEDPVILNNSDPVSNIDVDECLRQSGVVDTVDAYLKSGNAWVTGDLEWYDKKKRSMSEKLHYRRFGCVLGPRPVAANLSLESRAALNNSQQLESHVALNNPQQDLPAKEHSQSENDKSAVDNEIDPQSENAKTDAKTAAETAAETAAGKENKSKLIAALRIRRAILSHPREWREAARRAYHGDYVPDYHDIEFPWTDGMVPISRSFKDDGTLTSWGAVLMSTEDSSKYLDLLLQGSAVEIKQFHEGKKNKAESMPLPFRFGDDVPHGLLVLQPRGAFLDCGMKTGDLIVSIQPLKWPYINNWPEPGEMFPPFVNLAPLTHIQRLKLLDSFEKGNIIVKRLSFDHDYPGQTFVDSAMTFGQELLEDAYDRVNKSKNPQETTSPPEAIHQQTDALPTGTKVAEGVEDDAKGQEPVVVAEDVEDDAKGQEPVVVTTVREAEQIAHPNQEPVVVTTVQEGEQIAHPNSDAIDMFGHLDSKAQTAQKSRASRLSKCSIPDFMKWQHKEITLTVSRSKTKDGVWRDWRFSSTSTEACERGLRDLLQATDKELMENESFQSKTMFPMKLQGALPRGMLVFESGDGLKVGDLIFQARAQKYISSDALAPATIFLDLSQLTQKSRELYFQEVAEAEVKIMRPLDGNGLKMMQFSVHFAQKVVGDAFKDAKNHIDRDTFKSYCLFYARRMKEQCAANATYTSVDPFPVHPRHAFPSLAEEVGKEQINKWIELGWPKQATPHTPPTTSENAQKPADTNQAVSPLHNQATGKKRPATVTPKGDSPKIKRRRPIFL